MSFPTHIIPEGFETITLAEMSEVRLMNRTDSKYLANVSKIGEVLKHAVPFYYIQRIDGVAPAHYGTRYFDTDDLFFYREHHNRRLCRQKVRVRSYLDSLLSFLEVKNKNNKGKTQKLRIRVEEELPERFDQEDSVHFLEEIVPFSAGALHPSLDNEFYRITLVNKEKTERITMDFDLRFKNVRTGYSYHLPQIVVIEIKQDGNLSSRMQQLLLEARIPRKSFSKYCMGIVLTDPFVKQNRFKPKERYLERLCHESGCGCSSPEPTLLSNRV